MTCHNLPYDDLPERHNLAKSSPSANGVTWHWLAYEIVEQVKRVHLFCEALGQVQVLLAAWPKRHVLSTAMKYHNISIYNTYNMYSIMSL